MDHLSGQQSTSKTRSVDRTSRQMMRPHQRIFATFGLVFATALLIRFAGSRWGEWPWYFSPREAAFDQIELIVFFLVPLGITASIALLAGRARRWILGMLVLTFLLSLV